MPSAAELRKGLARTCRRLADLGFTPGSSGNVSARLGRRSIIITPSGYALSEVKPRDLVRARLDGTPCSAGAVPSAEVMIHALVYRSRPDVNAVVHAHAPACMSFAMARKDFGKPCNLEIYATIGRPALVPFAPTGEFGPLIGPLLNKADVFLLANHGVITLGRTLGEAQRRLEVLENFALSLLFCHLIGGPVPLSATELVRIEQFMERVGLPRPRSLARRKVRRERRSR